MKEVVTKVIDAVTQEDFHGAFQKMFKRYNKYIAAGGDYLEGDYSFICVLSIKVPIRKKSAHLFNDPRIYTIPLCLFSLHFNSWSIWFFFELLLEEISVSPSKFLFLRHDLVISSDISSVGFFFSPFLLPSIWLSCWY